MAGENYSAKWRSTTRKRILERDGYICGWCSCDLRIKGNIPTVDHIVSIKTGKERGWTDQEINDDSNLVAACKPCNSSRAHRAGPPKRTRQRGLQDRTDASSVDARDPAVLSRSPDPWPGVLLVSLPEGGSVPGTGDNAPRWTMTPTKGLI
jgi:hypothetical protein